MDGGSTQSSYHASCRLCEISVPADLMRPRRLFIACVVSDDRLRGSYVNGPLAESSYGGSPDHRLSAIVWHPQCPPHTCSLSISLHVPVSQGHVVTTRHVRF